MKNRFKKLLSLLLVLATLASAFTVFGFAADDTAVGETESDGETTADSVVAYNRDFSDGWDFTNGFAANLPRGHIFDIDYEKTFDGGYNYFARIQATDTVAAKEPYTNGFNQLSFRSFDYPNSGHVYVEFDIMADDFCNIGNIMYSRTEGENARGTMTNILWIDNNRLYVLKNDGQYKEHEGIPLADNWVHVVIDYDYTNEEYDRDAKFDINVTVDDQKFTTCVNASNYGYTGLDIIRIGIPEIKGTEEAIAAASAARDGHGFCMDNLQIYTSPDGRLTKEEIDAQGYGSLINVNQKKTVVIKEEGNEKTAYEYIDEALCMKVGVNYALKNGEKVNIKNGTYGAPVEYDGKIVIPFEILIDYMDAGLFVHEDKKSYDISTGTSSTYLVMGRDIATVGGEVVALSMAPGYYTDPKTGEQYAVIALDDFETLFPGYYVTYDSMGLIIISKIDNLLNRKDNLEDMLKVMKRFVYNLVDADTVLELAREHTNNFTHPYIIADQSVFDRLTAIWNGTDTTVYDIDVKGKIDEEVERAYEVYRSIALSDPMLDENGDVILDENGNPVFDEIGHVVVDENGDVVLDEEGEEIFEENESLTYNKYYGLDWRKQNTQILIYPHVDNNGYDPDGGRQTESYEALQYAVDLAFGYAITYDIKLALLAYDIMVELGEWNHWAPGCFLMTAQAGHRYALAFDWIYNCVSRLEAGEYDAEITAPDGSLPSEYYSNAYLERLLYKNAVRAGYLASTFQYHGWYRSNGDLNSYYYTTMDSNWNAVCTGGMWISSLMLLGSDQIGVLGEGEGEAPYSETAAWLIANNIETIVNYGIDMYAPDGSYVESPGYWSLGSNYLFEGLAALWSCLGDDFGILDAAGMDKTCYFACNIESNEYIEFGYHDSGEINSMDTSRFYFVAMATEDPVLSAIRSLQINNEKVISERKITYFDLLFFPFEGVGESAEVELPLDYYMDGIDTFVSRSSWETGGLYVGLHGGDNSGGHGNLDSGTFVYHNAGVYWLCEMGKDNYNAFGYFSGATRYRYYRNNAEGQNVIVLASQPVDVPYGQLRYAESDLTDWFSNEYGSYAILDNTAIYGKFATQIRRGMLLTNDRSTVVIQDEITLPNIETLYWCAHFRDSELDYDIVNNGRTMYLYKRNSIGVITQTLRLSIVSRNSYEKFVVTSAGETEADRLLKGSNGTVDYNWSYQQGANVTEYGRGDFKRITIKAETNTWNMAVVIELIDSKETPVGYNYLQPMNTWRPSGAGDSNNVVEDLTEYREKPELSSISSNMRMARSIYNRGNAYTTGTDSYYYYMTNVYYTYINFYDVPEVLTKYTNDLAEFTERKAEYDEFIAAINSKVKTVRQISQRLMGV